MKKKSLCAMLMAGLMVISSLAGCQPSSSDSNSGSSGNASAQTRPTTNGKEENSFTLAVEDQVTSFDPELFTLQVEDTVIVQMYEPLFYVMNDGSIGNVLLESYTENEDGSVDFVLKSDVQFHSGDTLTSEDVEYTLSRCENSPLCSPVYDAVKMTIEDDTHFTWTFEEATFADLASYVQSMGIVNKSYCETILENPTDNLQFNVDGTGPYCLDSVADNGDVTLQRFENYHDTVSIDTLYFRYVSGNTEMAFESGDLDYTTYTAANADLIESYSNVSTSSQEANNVVFITLNCAEGMPTSDIRVRQAVAYCLNREELTEIASNGSGTAAYNLSTPLVNYYDDVCDHFETNVETANDLLSQAGYSENNPVELTLICMSAQTDWIAACEIMKEELEQSYFTVNIEEISDTSRFFTGDFDLGMISIGLTNQFTSYSTLFDTASGMNLAMYEEPDVLEAFSAISDEATTQNAMKVATESLAYIPIYYPTIYFAFDGDLNTGEFYTSVSTFLFKDFSWKE